MNLERQTKENRKKGVEKFEGERERERERERIAFRINNRNAKIECRKWNSEIARIKIEIKSREG